MRNGWWPATWTITTRCGCTAPSVMSRPGINLKGGRKPSLRTGIGNWRKPANGGKPTGKRPWPRPTRRLQQPGLDLHRGHETLNPGKVQFRLKQNMGLLGLIAALAYYFYARRLKYEEKKLEALPAEERARVTDERLSRYGIDAANLTREDKNRLILEEMEKRYRFARLCVVVFAVAFVLCFALASAAFVFAMDQRPKEFQELKSELEKRKAWDE